MKLAQVGSIANKANAADAKSRAADCSVMCKGKYETHYYNLSYFDVHEIPRGAN
jgi:hypothetical protein